MPFILAGTGVMVAALVVLPFPTTIALILQFLWVSYAGYFTAYAPYRALYPDLVADEARGRSQGLQNTAREVGLGASLVGGGSSWVWRPLPLIAGAVGAVLITVAFRWRIREGPRRRERPERMAIAAGIVMTLPYGLLMGLMHTDRHGELAGLFALSQGMGVMLGPILGGLAVQLLKPVFPGTDGYAAAFGVAAVAVLASVPGVMRMRRASEHER